MKGFTLVELLIVITIIAILAMMVLFSVSPFKQINKGYDSVRKKDLNNIKIALENYNSDHLCYPPAGILDVCGGDQLAPYLDPIPCDPQTKENYLYIPEEGNVCSGYRVLTTLKNRTDPFIEQVGCNIAMGCGTGGDVSYNYGVSSPGLLVGIYTPTSTPTPTGSTTPTPSLTPTATTTPTPSGTTTPTPTPTPTPTSTPTPTATPTSPPQNNYTCSYIGECVFYADPSLHGCPLPYFTEDTCNNECGNPAKWCTLP